MLILGKCADRILISTRSLCLFNDVSNKHQTTKIFFSYGSENFLMLKDYGVGTLF